MGEGSRKDAKPQSRNLPHLPGHAPRALAIDKNKNFFLLRAPDRSDSKKNCGFAALREISTSVGPSSLSVVPHREI
jgi:hypothetical protein